MLSTTHTTHESISHPLSPPSKRKHAKSLTNKPNIIISYMSQLVSVSVSNERVTYIHSLINLCHITNTIEANCEHQQQPFVHIVLRPASICGVITIQRGCWLWSGGVVVRPSTIWFVMFDCSNYRLEIEGKYTNNGNLNDQTGQQIGQHKILFICSVERGNYEMKISYRESINSLILNIKTKHNHQKTLVRICDGRFFLLTVNKITSTDKIKIKIRTFTLNANICFLRT